jgi:hypothetical protein
LIARPPATLTDMDDVVSAFDKVLKQKDSLVHGSLVQHASP